MVAIDDGAKPARDGELLSDVTNALRELLDRVYLIAARLDPPALDTTLSNTDIVLVTLSDRCPGGPPGRRPGAGGESCGGE